jgi:hypothetical protein
MGVCKLQVSYMNFDGSYDSTEVINEHTKYHYVMFNDCQEDGTVRVSEYSDPACQRLLSEGTTNLGDSAMSFNLCSMHSTSSGTTQMYIQSRCTMGPATAKYA